MARHIYRLVGLIVLITTATILSGGCGSSDSEPNVTNNTTDMTGVSRRDGFVVYIEDPFPSRVMDIVDGMPDPVGTLALNRFIGINREQDLIVGEDIYMAFSSVGEDLFSDVFVSMVALDGVSLPVYYHRAISEWGNEIVHIESPSNLDKSVSYLFTLAIGDAYGQVSEPVSLVMDAVDPGTSDLTVNLTWPSATNQELVLYQPDDFLFIDPIWRPYTPATGGQMMGHENLRNWNSNGACIIDGRNSETIRYVAVTPPDGTYEIRVRYDNDCGTGPEDYTVTLTIDGVEQTFTGRVEKEGDVAIVTEFEYVRP